MRVPALFNWSSGKDSALALHRILQQQDYEVVALLTTVNAQYDRVSMHGVRRSLLEAQADALGIPLTQVVMPESPTMEAYEDAMRQALLPFVAQGVSASIFGDIFLEDLRAYRERKLAELGMHGVFPLWKEPTDALVREFLGLGFRSIVTCVNAQYLDRRFVGREIDAQFVRDLPPSVDPCGENGEFHTFAFDGPIFKTPVRVQRGEIVSRRYERPASPSTTDDVCGGTDDPFAAEFWYCDLRPE
jgi:uncharacterized protein (TIGR00290 family)